MAVRLYSERLNSAEHLERNGYFVCTSSFLNWVQKVTSLFFYGSLIMGAFLCNGKNSLDSVSLLKLYFKDNSSKLLPC